MVNQISSLLKGALSPYAIIYWFAFSPSLLLGGLNLTLGDLAVSVGIFLYIQKRHTLVLPRSLIVLLVYFLMVIMFSFIASAYWLDCAYSPKHILQSMRPIVYIVYLGLVGGSIKNESRGAIKGFLMVGFIVISIFSLALLARVGGTFSHDNVWSYDPTTRLVGLRGIILLGKGKEIAGTDSINFGLFVSLLGTLSIEMWRRWKEHMWLFIGIILLLEAQLSLTKSTTVFIIVYLLVWLGSKGLKWISGLVAAQQSAKARMSSLVIVTLITVAAILALTINDTRDVLLVRFRGVDGRLLLFDSSASARVDLVKSYWEYLGNNMHAIILGVGPGGLACLVGRDHLEGLLPTAFAEMGLMSGLLLTGLAGTLNIVSDRSSLQQRWLAHICVPFLVVSLFASLTVYSSLVYPLIFTCCMYKRKKVLPEA